MQDLSRERGVPSSAAKTEVCQVFMLQKGSGVMVGQPLPIETEKLTQTAISVEDTEERFFITFMN